MVGALAADSSRAVVVTDGDLTAPGPRILYVNKAFERMSGYDRAELLGRSPRMLQGEKTSLASRRQLARALRKGQRNKIVLVNYRKDGEAYRCEIDVFPILDARSVLVNAVALERELPRAPGRRPRAAA
ncbi:PAS domain-containing protein [Caulobacter segnis]